MKPYRYNVYKQSISQRQIPRESHACTPTNDISVSLCQLHLDHLEDDISGLNYRKPTPGLIQEVRGLSNQASCVCYSIINNRLLQ